MTSEAAKVELPRWAETVRRKYLGGEASMFVLHRNVFDHVLCGARLWPLAEFLAHVLLWDNKDQILLYDAASGIRALKTPSGGALGQSVALGQALGQAADEVQDASSDALARIEVQLMAKDRLAVIISYAGTVAPPGDESFLAQQDRVNVVRLHRWSLSPTIVGRDNVIFLLSESLAELHPRLVANPRVAAIEVPMPDHEERVAAIRHADPGIDPEHVQRLAGHTSGLRVMQIVQLLTPGKPASLNDAERERFIASLLGGTKDAAVRAAKLAGLTRGMDLDDVRHLINPDQPLPETQQHDPYAAILELAHRRKREIIEKECAGLIEFIDSSHDLSAVGGNEGIKAELDQVARAVRAGDRSSTPMGLLFVGPMGCGKTFVAKAFVKSTGLTAVALKNFRSKWVGATEGNLEKVLGMVKSLGPIVLIIDEGDRSFGGQSEDSDGGTSSRVIARLKEFMSDPDNRGRVLFILMTNRPDKLDIDIKRAGRLDRKIPFFYAQAAQEVEQILAALLRRYGIASDIDWAAARATTSATLVGYSNADIEAVVLLALDLSKRAGTSVTAALFEQAAQDYIPTRDTHMIEYMELLAVFEASRRTLLPQKYRDLSSEALQQRLRELKLSLRL
jgi:transitional endoplasmic reticulum ATPase